ncbi:MAG: GDSL-type esterase/lipase family protein [Bacteroidales bacterium]|nr:GDSL-type esterase/lipase family protein [Bacteroidales bacterium]
MLASHAACWIAALALAQPAPTPTPTDPFARWEKEIHRVEALQKEQTIRPGGVVFAGSSSIRLWKLTDSFPNLGAVNSGFGGSQIRDCTHFAHRIIIPCRPATIVFYAGDNDVAAKRTPEQVRDDFQKFVAVIHKELPKCRILYIAIKPSLKRIQQRETQDQANALVKKICEANPSLHYVDVVTPMLGQDGKPRAELFAKDGLHMSAKGYAVWAELLMPLLTHSPSQPSKGK